MAEGVRPLLPQRIPASFNRCPTTVLQALSSAPLPMHQPCAWYSGYSLRWACLARYSTTRDRLRDACLAGPVHLPRLVMNIEFSYHDNTWTFSPFPAETSIGHHWPPHSLIGLPALTQPGSPR